MIPIASSRSRLLWQLPLGLLCLVVALPILSLLKTWAQVDADIWQHLWQTQLLGLISNTLVLVVGVAIGVTLLGVSLAWLTAACDFPGRKVFDWALILPLAIPAYVLAFVVLGVFDFGGVVQNLLRQSGLVNYLDVRNAFTVICVMTAVLYPYVYLLARAAFLAQGPELLEIARSLGMRPLPAFFRVVLPAVRPAIIAGVSLALMETLADFGAVSIFGFDTFTTAIYKSWYSLFSLETAAQLASLLLLFVILTLMTERYFRPRHQLDEKTSRSPQRIKLTSAQAWMATIFCVWVLLLAVVLPMVQLIAWGMGNLGYLLEPEFRSLAIRTFFLGAIAALLVAAIAILCAFASRRLKSDVLAETAGLGYALPGSVLAVGIMFVLGGTDSFWVWMGSMLSLDLKPIFLGSLAGLILAYVIRFFRPGYGAVASGLQRVRHSYIESSALMGVPKSRVFFGVSLPLILPGVLTGALIVFVDVIKEMPASLLLRPFGWDTLAIKIYELTSEGEWQRAGLAALILVLISAIPVVLLIRQSRLTSSSAKS